MFLSVAREARGGEARERFAFSRCGEESLKSGIIPARVQREYDADFCEADSYAAEFEW